MQTTDDLTLWCALNQMIAAYWADVDENGGLTAHDFYLPDALYAIGNNRFEGRDKIQAFYARRRYGTIVTRHVVSNVRVVDETPQQARMLGLMTLYRADGVYKDRQNEAEAAKVGQIVRDLLRRAQPPSIGIACFNITQRDLKLEIRRLNDDAAVTGIMMHLPLPDHLLYGTIALNNQPVTRADTRRARTPLRN